MDEIKEAADEEALTHDVEVGTQMTHRVTPSTKESRSVQPSEAVSDSNNCENPLFFSDHLYIKELHAWLN